MSLFDRLRDIAEDIKDDFVDYYGLRPPPRQYYRQSPNAQPDVTPAVRTNAPQMPASYSAAQTPVSAGFSSPQPLPGNPISVYVTLDGNGNGTAQIGPSRVREHWQVAGGGVSVATAMKQATCSLYIGSSVGPSTFIGQSALGSSGDTWNGNGMDIQPGQYIFAVWEGGDAYQVATLTVTGTYTIGS